MITTPFRKTFTEHRLRANRDAELSRVGITAEQLQIVDEVIARHREDSARKMSDDSHELPGWKAFALHAEIPYATVFVSQDHPTDLEMAGAGGLRRDYE
jgi:hypothetical protein